MLYWGSPLCVCEDEAQACTTRDRPRVRPRSNCRACMSPPSRRGKEIVLVLQQRRSNHQALDLAGALVNLGDLRVAKMPLDREVGQIAVAAEDLHRLLGGAVGHL